MKNSVNRSVSFLFACALLVPFTFAASATASEPHHEEAVDALLQGGEGRNLANLSEAQQRTLIGDLDQAIEVMLAADIAIAKEKGQSPDSVDEIAAIRAKGLAAMRRDDLATAITLLDQTYHRLQQHVMGMRSGDNLTVPLPAAATEQAWLDSKRRYEDWMFVANWLQSGAANVQIDADQLEVANSNARNLYEKATEHAKAQRWSEANSLMDQAYSVMVTAWREQGVEI